MPNTRTGQPRQVTLHTDVVLQTLVVTDTTITANLQNVTSLADGTEVGRTAVNGNSISPPYQITELPREVQDAVAAVKDYFLSLAP